MRLILNRQTDYAFRALIALATRDDPRLSARSIGAAVAIPGTYVGPIMADLTRAGLVDGLAGRTGGYRLTRRSDTISLRDVIDAVEAGEQPERCSLADRACDPTRQCALHPIWAAASAAYLETFGSVTLAELAASDAGLREGVV
jgi:Rrf2 family protein